MHVAKNETRSNCTHNIWSFSIKFSVYSRYFLVKNIILRHLSECFNGDIGTKSSGQMRLFRLFPAYHHHPLSQICRRIQKKNLAITYLLSIECIEICACSLLCLTNCKIQSKNAIIARAIITQRETGTRMLVVDIVAKATILFYITLATNNVANICVSISYIYAYVNMIYVCIYIYIFIHTYVYIYIYVYLHL